MPKIEYGIKNVYFAKRTEDASGNITYATPIAVPNARSTDLAAQGDQTAVYADNIQIYTTNTNQGYNGSLAFTYIPDEIREQFLNEKRDVSGNLFEDANAQQVTFAMMFQFETDVKAIRHLFYNCTLTRPNIASSTKETGVSVNDKSLTITALPDNKLLPGYDIVKIKTTETTEETVYNEWFNEVYIPEVVEI